jgi:hypothetical protein
LLLAGLGVFLPRIYSPSRAFFDMDLTTILTVSSIALLVLFLAWRGYIALRRYSCCGSCGCDLMTKKERKAYEARKACIGCKKLDGSDTKG